MRYICESPLFANLRLHISPHTCFAVPFGAMLPYMFNKAGVNVSCLGIPDLQSPRHAIEPELCPPTPLSPTGRAGRGGQMKLRAPDQVGAASPDNKN